MVVYGPDKLVYVGMGDGGSGGDPENRAQNPSSRLGKILRLDPARPGAAPRWSRSASATRGASPSTGRTATSGSATSARARSRRSTTWRGPLTGLLNFGWDVYEGRSSFEQKALGPGRLVPPVAQYTHDEGCSITGGYVYRGTAVPAAKGRYFYGDYCSGTIWSLRPSGGTATGIRREPSPCAASPRSARTRPASSISSAATPCTGSPRSSARSRRHTSTPTATPTVSRTRRTRRRAGRGRSAGAPRR